MKRYFLSFGLMLSVALLFAANAFQGGPEITFNKEIHDFGTVEQYGNTTCTFEFKNTGTAPLIISNAKGSCGCTVPEWPKNPIAPGETGVITVRYDNKRIGPINKSVTITSNAVNAPTKTIRIKGHINKKPQESTMPVQKTGAPVAK